MAAGSQMALGPVLLAGERAPRRPQQVTQGTDESRQGWGR